MILMPKLDIRLICFEESHVEPSKSLDSKHNFSIRNIHPNTFSVTLAEDLLVSFSFCAFWPEPALGIEFLGIREYVLVGVGAVA